VGIRRTATRVVLDARLRIGTDAQLVRTSGEVPTIVFTSPDRADSRKARTLMGHGVEVVGVRERERGVCLTSVLRYLAKRGMTNILVEGGPTILDSFLKKQLVDEAIVFVAPRLVGSKSAVADNGWISARMRAEDVEVARSGIDLRYRWRLTPAGDL
jgi:riboflavin biosynthesis pyrimidine reductase